MSAAAASFPRVTTLADHLVGARSRVTDAGLVLSGVAVVGALAQIEVPLWPVPISGQTLGVMVVGASLGARRAASSMVAYLLLGLAGLPIFAGATGGLASVAKPSFGFIIGFIFAAAFAGWLAQRQWDRHRWYALLGFLGASIIPFLFGVPYMGFILGRLGMPNDPATLLSLGVTPFILGGVIKWLIAASVLPLAWRAVRELDRRSGC